MYKINHGCRQYDEGNLIEIDYSLVEMIEWSKESRDHAEDEDGEALESRR